MRRANDSTRRRFAVVLLLLLLHAAAPAGGPEPEYRVKAAILCNIARFVRWPAAEGNSTDICILGEDPFGGALDDATRGRQIDGRAVVLRRYHDPEDLTGCHILFIAGSESRRVEQIVRRVAPFPTLTISEIPRFTSRGGMVNFVLSGGRVNLEINLAAARRARIEISSQLLALARIYTEGR